MTGTRSNNRGYGRRYHLLDGIRGATLVSMILYHAAWDFVYIAGVDWPWYHTQGAYYWQQSICWTFILLSGFCVNLSGHRWKRGVLVSGAGLLVTAVTLVFMYEDRVIFGVLTFLGAAMLLTALLHRLLTRVHGVIGFLVSAYLFYVFRAVNSGFLQLLPGVTVSLPASWYPAMPAAAAGAAPGAYAGTYLATFLGFTADGFYSTDYFSLLPWIFLFWCGFYLGILLRRDGTMTSRVMTWNVRPLSFLGRHSLLIYLLHQPVLYMIVVLGGYAGLW